jgi:GNAT superfamily N-acetyltransferase
VLHRIPYSEEIASRLSALFTDDRPIPIRMWAILDGITQGRILADDPQAPSFAVVQERAEGTAYIGGAPSRLALDEAVARLRQEQEVVVCLWRDSPLGALLPDAPDYVGEAIDFLDRAPSVDLSRLAVAPAGCALRRIDRDNAPLLEGFGYYAATFGGIEPALQRTAGFCLVRDGLAVSEAVAGPFARGVAEIGVGTRDGHRRQGLATIVSAAVIQDCEARGFTPFWNASQQNAPSIALARRLGFQSERPFAVLAWSRRS